MADRKQSYVYQKGRLLAIVVEKKEVRCWLLIYSLDDWAWILRMKFGVGGDGALVAAPLGMHPFEMYIFCWWFEGIQLQ